MTEEFDILHEAKKLRLLAAALELQHYTSTAANIVPIPGGDRVIAIGTPAQVRALMGGTAAASMRTEGFVDARGNVCLPVDQPALPPKPPTTYNGYSDGSEPLWTAEQMDDYAHAAIARAASICDGVAGKSKNSLFRSGAKICAGEIRAALAGDQVDSEGGHHD
jgi:hypothetical protein